MKKPGEEVTLIKADEKRATNTLSVDLYSRSLRGKRYNYTDVEMYQC